MVRIKEAWKKKQKRQVKATTRSLLERSGRMIDIHKVGAKQAAGNEERPETRSTRLLQEGCHEIVNERVARVMNWRQGWEGARSCTANQY